MRRRSLTGPLLLLLIGGLFLWSNLHPDVPVWHILVQYWPFLLIAWGLIRLLEALFPGGDEWRGSFSGGEIWLIILISVAGMGAWQARDFGIRLGNSGFGEWFGEQYDFPISVSAPAAGITRVVFENPHGNITVSGADTPQVSVTGHRLIRSLNRTDADRANALAPVEIVPQGDRLLVRTNQDRGPSNQRISDDLVEVSVPRGVAVEVRGRQGGDYDISGVSGDVDLFANHADVRISNVGGNARIEIGRTDSIHAVDVKGKLDIQGQGADLDLENIQGPVTVSGAYNGSLSFKKLAKPLQFEGARNTELNAQAIPGEISMDLSQFSANDVTGPMKLSTRSLDIHVHQVTRSLEVETERGDIELLPGAPMPTIEARSGEGRIELALPSQGAFHLDATAEHGDVTNDFGAPIRQEVDGHTATLKGNVGNGPLVHITASRGSVEVRKEDAASSPAPAGKAPPEKRDIKNPGETELRL
jgi:DUF4097 and DUF4098 domain-containing protein YvlB